MKHSTIALIIALVLAFGASTFGIGWILSRHKYDKPLQGADTVYVEKWIEAPVEEPKDSTPLKPKIVYLPIAVHDTTFVHDTTAVHDSVMVEVPIWEKSYVSQNYSLTVRGFQPELVDIWIRQQEKIVTIPYRKHWSFTLGPQLGYGFTPQGWQPYAGAGITFGYSF